MATHAINYHAATDLRSIDDKMASDHLHPATVKHTRRLVFELNVVVADIVVRMIAVAAAVAAVEQVQANVDEDMVFVDHVCHVGYRRIDQTLVTSSVLIGSTVNCSSSSVIVAVMVADGAIMANSLNAVDQK